MAASRPGARRRPRKQCAFPRVSRYLAPACPPGAGGWACPSRLPLSAALLASSGPPQPQSPRASSDPPAGPAHLPSSPPPAGRPSCSSSSSSCTPATALGALLRAPLPPASDPFHSVFFSLSTHFVACTSTARRCLLIALTPASPLFSYPPLPPPGPRRASTNPSLAQSIAMADEVSPPARCSLRGAARRGACLPAAACLSPARSCKNHPASRLVPHDTKRRPPPRTQVAASRAARPLFPFPCPFPRQLPLVRLPSPRRRHGNASCRGLGGVGAVCLRPAPAPCARCTVPAVLGRPGDVCRVG